MIKNTIILALLLISTVTLAEEKVLKANTHIPINNGFTAVKSADINGDGLIDFLVSGKNQKGIQVYINKGGFQFSLLNSLSVSGHVNDFVAADFDGDGDLDLWLGRDSGEFHDEDELLINDGHANFSKTVMQLSHNWSYEGTDQLLSYDFNNDGHVDVLRVQRRSSGLKPVGTFLYLNDGQANFSEKKLNIVIGSYAAVADFDQDGDVDIWSLQGSLDVFNNDGEGGFSQEDTTETNVYANHYVNATFEDINQDGLLDLQLFSTSFFLPRFINKGNGEFEAGGVAVYLSPPGIQNGVFLDVDTDGDLDLWYTHQDDINSKIIKTTEDGSIDLSGNEVVINESQILHSVGNDFNSDGNTDVVSLGARGIQIWNQNEPGQFQEMESNNLNQLWGKFRKSVLLDMNNDAIKDLLLVGESGVRVGLGNGRSGFSELQEWSNETIYRFHAADFDKDGWGDVSFIGGSGEVKVLFNNKNNGFDAVEIPLTSADPFTSNRTNPYKILSGDLTGDGNLELVVQEYLGPVHVFSQNDSDRSYSLLQQILGGYISSEIQDMDSDGVQDLVGNNHSPDFELGDPTQGIVVYQHSENQLRKTASYEVDLFYSELLVSDLNNDGSADILIPRPDNQRFTFLTLNADSLDSQQLTIPTSSSPLAAADFNSDNIVDFVTVEGNVLISQGSGYSELNLVGQTLGNDSVMTSVDDIDNDSDLDLVLFEEVSGVSTFINTTIDQDFSGLWYNLEQSGHGLQVEEVISNGIPQVNLAWYVYDQGRPMWVTGVGPIDGNSATIPLAITSGASFGTAFNSDDVAVERWGTMTLTFTDKHKLNMKWDGTEYGFSQGEMPLDRLSVLSGDLKNQTGIKTCHTGSWNNVTENGHGFLVQVIAGDVDRMILTWFTYHNGEQYWMIADGNIEGETAVMNAYSASGPEFPPNYDSSDYSPNLWGQITFKIENDESAIVSWQPNLAGFEAGSLSVNKLTYIDRYRCH